MELIEEHIVELALLLLQKAKIEEKLRQTFKCFLRKLFSCCGMKNIELELQYLNDTIASMKEKRDILEYAKPLTPAIKTTLV